MLKSICCFQGIKARVLETFVMLFLLGLLILGIVWVASALIDNDDASMESLYGINLSCYCCVCICVFNGGLICDLLCFFSRFVGVLSAVPLLVHLSDGWPVAAQ